MTVIPPFLNLKVHVKLHSSNSITKQRVRKPLKVVKMDDYTQCELIV